MLSRLIGLPWWVYAGAATVALSGAAYGGYKVRDLACDATAATMREQAATAILRAAQRANEVSADYEATRAGNASQATTDRTTIIREYHNVQVPAECAPPAAVADSLRRATERANRAATGEPSATLPATGDATGTDGGR
jgi:hypothetical protein